MICVYMVYIKAMERGDKEGSLSQGVCKQKKKRKKWPSCSFPIPWCVCVINSFSQNVGKKKKGLSKAATYQVAGTERKKKKKAGVDRLQP